MDFKENNECSHYVQANLSVADVPPPTASMRKGGSHFIGADKMCQSQSVVFTLTGIGQEPGTSLHAVRARQPVLDATEAHCMRRSPSTIGQTAVPAAQTARKSLETQPVWPQNTLKRQRPRSRRRCSDVPILFAGVKIPLCFALGIRLVSEHVILTIQLR